MKKLVVGITGATGVTFGVNLVKYLIREKRGVIEPHVIMSDSAILVCKSELDVTLSATGDIVDLFGYRKDKNLQGFGLYSNSFIDSGIASGSFLTEGMVVIPCTIKTTSDIAYSRTENLITRAADVTLKEGRKLVLCVRETPLHKGHLQNLVRCADMGAIIMPLMVSLYGGMETIQDMSDHFIGRVLDQFRIHNNLTRRYKGGKR